MGKKYDTSWDLVKSKKGNMPANEDSYNKIYNQWQLRSWVPWLNSKLTFPFFVKRMDDEDDAYFTDVADHEPFRLGHVMKVIGIEMEDDLYGIILNVREGRKVGYVPLCDVQVLDKEDPNYWPIREYVVWFANQ